MLKAQKEYYGGQRKQRKRRCFNTGNQDGSGDERKGIQYDVSGVLTGSEL